MKTKPTKSEDGGYFEVLDGFPSDVVAVAVHGRIDRDDYEKVLDPLIDARVKTSGKVHCYCEIAPDFEGFSAGAMLKDAGMGITRRREFGRVALVTDIEWLRVGLGLVDPFFPGEMRAFGLEDKAAARDWIAAYGGGPHEISKVAVDKRPKKVVDLA